MNNVKIIYIYLLLVIAEKINFDWVAFWILFSLTIIAAFARAFKELKEV